MAQTTEERLEAVRTLIDRRLADGIKAHGTVEYNVIRDSIDELIKLEDRLLAQLAAETPGGATNYAQFARGGDGGAASVLA